MRRLLVTVFAALALGASSLATAAAAAAEAAYQKVAAEILQDLYARNRRMKDGAVFFPFGTDDNGLPTERLVSILATGRPPQ